ncbi:MAG: ferric reductase-like transmembrane domain-containing protein [Caldilineaceae bacterium]
MIRHWVQRTVLFLAGTIGGLVFGLLVLGIGYWFFNTTALGTQLQTLIGFTDKTPWYFSRAAGTVAYLLLTASTVWGLLLTTKLVKTTVPAPLTLAMHNILGWMAVIATTAHALALLFDSYYVYTLANLVVPFTGPYRPGWVGVGIVGLYIMVVTAASFSWRSWMGQIWWRRLHYFTYVAYGLATIHGLLAGTDSGDLGMKLMFWGSALLITAMTAYRIWATTSSKKVVHAYFELQN